MSEAAVLQEATVEAPINYVAAMSERPKFHAQDHKRDNLRYDTRVMPITDARDWRQPPSLDLEGAALVDSPTKVSDFRDPDEVRRVYLPEVEELIRRATGAAQVFMLGGGGLVRYAERSPHFGTGMNTQPARFPHMDFTSATAPGLVDNVFGSSKVALKPGQRLVGYNIWRAISGPPQDVPLAVCDARTVERSDLMEADGVYDEGEPSTWWELEAFLLKHNPRHRWLFFRNMRPDEALVFRAYDNLPGWRSGVPHTAFDDPSCPPGGPARVSIEARAFAVYD
jgi:hypothetical protein